MTTLSWPLLSRVAPGSLDWGLVSNTTAFQSPLSGSVQTVEMPGARWKVSFALENLNEADAALLQATLVRLRGRSGRIALYNFERPSPRGTVTGTPLVNGAGQTGTALNIDGCGISKTLLTGDYIGVNGELKMVVADATSNGAGQMTLTIEPPLRASPADNASITLIKPTATFMLAGDESAWSVRAPVLADIPIDLVEAWS